MILLFVPTSSSLSPSLPPSLPPSLYNFTTGPYAIITHGFVGMSALLQGRKGAKDVDSDTSQEGPMSLVASPPSSFIKPTMISDVLLEGGEEEEKEEEEEEETEESWRYRDLELPVESLGAILTLAVCRVRVSKICIRIWRNFKSWTRWRLRATAQRAWGEIVTMPPFLAASSLSGWKKRRGGVMAGRRGGGGEGEGDVVGSLSQVGNEWHRCRPTHPREQ